MIDEILKKAENNQKLTDEEFLELLNISNDEELNKLFDTAAKIRDQQSKTIKLTSLNIGLYFLILSELLKYTAYPSTL